MKVNLKSITPDVEKNIVEIARVSSSREDKSENLSGLINYLIKHKHWSPFEHGHMTIEIVTSKSIGIQLLRHISFRFQEFSQRYARVENIEPVEFRLQAEKNRQSSTYVVGQIEQVDDEHGTSFRINMDEYDNPKMTRWLELVAQNFQNTIQLYNEGLKLGVAKECARMILPMATSTTIYMTGSIRSWIHFLDIRDDAHAQLEIQQIAKQIKKIFVIQLPIISKALGYD